MIKLSQMVGNLTKTTAFEVWHKLKESLK